MKKQVKRRVASKPRAIQTSRLLRLSHRKHSGHVLPRRTTSYPVLLMIVLCLGVFLAGWTRAVTADDTGSYDVSARVPGQTPTIPATIDLPLNADVTSSKPIDVKGTCPSNTYVELFRNNFPSGIGLCDQNGKYTISTDLFVGLNELIARVYSFSDTAGPDSASIAVTYKPTVSPSQSSESPTSESTSTPSSSSSEVSPQLVQEETKSPIRLTSDFAYLGHYAGQELTWPINIAGGVAPYAVSVDWGDGQHNLYSQKQDGLLNIEHKYKKAGAYKGSYVININIIDSLGSGSSLQLISIINNSASSSGFAGGLSATGTSITSDKLVKTIKYAWPSYGVVVLMLSSFWLGETRELATLKITSHKPRSR